MGSPRDSRFESAGELLGDLVSSFIPRFPTFKLYVRLGGLLFITLLLPRQDLVQSWAAGGGWNRAQPGAGARFRTARERIALVIERIFDHFNHYSIVNLNRASRAGLFVVLICL